MIKPEIDRWEWTAGTDKSIAVSHIYVVVEIDGYLYLTKGAVFKYHEFTYLQINILSKL